MSVRLAAQEAVSPNAPFILQDNVGQGTPLRTALWRYLNKIDYVKVPVILLETAAIVK